MINAIFFIVSTVIVGIFNIAGMSAKGNEIRRTFVEMPINLVKSAVGVDVNDETNPEAYFVSNIFEENINNYMSKSLKDLVPSYKIGFIYFNYKENGQFDFQTNGRPKYAQVKFNCRYFLNYEITEYLTFDARKV